MHWFAGVRSDDVGVTTAVVTATTGNVLQVFRLVQSPDSSGLGKAVAERLARSALLALQNRADGASAVLGRLF